jgi:hypothetical protein
MEGGEQTSIASSIRSSRFSAASTTVRAEIGLEGFHSRGRRFSFSGGELFGKPESLFGIKAAANCSTRFTVSASIARYRDDSFPAMKIPLVMDTVYRLEPFVATGYRRENEKIYKIPNAWFFKLFMIQCCI